MSDTTGGSLEGPWIRAQPEDFVVEEVALVEPEGTGEHCYLWVEKRGRNTEGVARELAALAGVAAREVGFAGRKDRQAVTRQWFSVPRVEPSQAQDWSLDSALVLKAARGSRRLRLGELAGNRFELRIRQVAKEVAAAAAERLAELERRGVPNRFGAQRFGRGGGNVAKGAALLCGERVAGDLRHRRFMVAALQAAVFNEVLDLRPWPYDEVVEGDLAVVHRSGRLFLADGEDDYESRVRDFEISSTGPLFGPKMRSAAGAVAELEVQALKNLGLSGSGDLTLPKGIRLYGERRPLRLRVQGAEHSLEAEDLWLRFELPPGAYATVVLEELFPGGLLEGPEPVEKNSPPA